jgi:hypothetical protein
MSAINRQIQKTLGRAAFWQQKGTLHAVNQDRRIRVLREQLRPHSTDATRMQADLKLDTNSDKISPVNAARHFREARQSTWQAFVDLKSWTEREAVVQAVRECPEGWQAYQQCYREAMKDYIRDDFYEICDEAGIAKWASIYASEGEMSVQLLKDSCLTGLVKYAESVEERGKRRYSMPRTVYPPGEAMNYEDEDPRKCLMTDVNMTAVACQHMQHDAPVQWIYHSPHLRMFLRGVMGCKDLFPYLCDLGVALNIMRPVQDAQTALGFHFDSIDSSTSSSKTLQPKGATGVIGIQDSVEGGERIVFPGVNRTKVGEVQGILEGYDPLHPDEKIGGSEPSVFRESTEGVLYLFNGGDVLHGVSSVRKGSRIASVFLFKEEPPSATADSTASANFFYSK